jgi:hypothetical protein
MSQIKKKYINLSLNTTYVHSYIILTIRKSFWKSIDLNSFLFLLKMEDNYLIAMWSEALIVTNI